MHSFILLELLMIASASSTGTTPIGKAPGPKGPAHLFNCEGRKTSTRTFDIRFNSFPVCYSKEKNEYRNADKDKPLVKVDYIDYTCKMDGKTPEVPKCCVKPVGTPAFNPKRCVTIDNLY
ncbi:hypothetical protein MJO29_008247 [Puccinia striiformis f. sp. tritici]|uniref:hypothetical protein n=1 Tax=Puccinia striiformis f. sp. tritici TaxID=168172 RepID=UPI00200853C9|nr:hypothetical protein Pst134EA_015571 [Puccinia striiformis f. sp. tritici]KAH9452741.1 hypothetical protein Pst134EB_016693 [Puccinia striiformis f. sp. tritici]KAH9463488.1 hypothetical protein Pst134EA_015571 [Puccinia striiformis f. sp. tritici]KAI7952616.1 hypothetical protein MJO29_008247 [Puccinia striiformis f. sp. tritici]KAI9609790.1 hypothetical protein KEM48_002741 [Puccinia striiformis f. sp. tritici PST-130]